MFRPFSLSQCLLMYRNVPTTTSQFTMEIHPIVLRWDDFAVTNCRIRYRLPATKCLWFSSLTSVYKEEDSLLHTQQVISHIRWDCCWQNHSFAWSLACGGHLTASSRVKHFYSHAKFGGFDYDNNADCDWAIEAEPGRNVQLTFLTFDVRL